MTTERLIPQLLDKPLSLREQVSVSLRAAITTGEMQQGITYSIPNLAEKFGVSATPVREAILDLVKEGLLVALPNKGFRIVDTSEEVLRKITEIRLLIEIPTTVRIAELITQDKIDEFRELALYIQSLAERADFVPFIENDRKFHHQILELSGNEPLVEYADQLRSQTRIHGLPFLIGTGRLESSSREHLTLLDAMEKKNFKEVGEVVAHHINYTIDALNAKHKRQLSEQVR